MNFEGVLKFLDNPTRYGSDTDPDMIKRGLSALHNPEKKVKIIHIAGTNGKGSVGDNLAQILFSHGKLVGHFTSPYVIEFNERIRINGENISDATLIKAANFVKAKLEKTKDYKKYRAFTLQFFTALKAFQIAGLEYGIIEAGIGGTGDITNVLDSEISIITKIGLDHMDRLGESVKEIGLNKAGIIKKNRPVFLMGQSTLVEEIISKEAKKKDAKLFISNTKDIDPKKCNNKLSIKWKNKRYEFEEKGLFQEENLALSLLVSDYLLEINEFNLKNALSKTGLPGRMAEINKRPRVIVDGMHNLPGIVPFVKNRDRDDSIGIIGMMDDKADEKILNLWKNAFETMFLVPLNYFGSWDPYEVKEKYFENENVYAFSSIKEALDEALKHDRTIYVLGSLYLAGEAYEYFKGIK